jgi:uncharacterized DUF497 family protein
MKVNLQALQFEWDAGNTDKNKQKHGVESWECEEVFFDVKKVMLGDRIHSDKEERHILLGKTRQERLLYLVFTIRKDNIRLMSAKDVTKRKEIDLYEKAT